MGGGGEEGRVGILTCIANLVIYNLCQAHNGAKLVLSSHSRLGF